MMERELPLEELLNQWAHTHRVSDIQAVQMRAEIIRADEVSSRGWWKGLMFESMSGVRNLSWPTILQPAGLGSPG